MSNFETQNTVLGIYNYNGKEKVVCACEDFTNNNNNILYEFENLVLSANPDKKIETEINDIMEVLEESVKLIDVDNAKEKFWDMFIIDSIIGNTDRHNGNWGFILNKETGKTTFSPIYDCGSCLNPMLEDKDLEKINYMTYIKQMKNEECNKAIHRGFRNIKINEIEKFIDEIECMSKTRKDFYKELINIRYNIIKKVYNVLQN